MDKFNPAIRVSLARRISSDFQRRFTKSEIDDILYNYGVENNATFKNNKQTYTYERIKRLEASLLQKIASDFNLVHGAVNVEQDDIDRIWGENRPRVFITHLAKVKGSANRLAEKLSDAAISSFVAHDSIKPLREWQNEIEKALQSADALIVICSSGIQESDWCDQEVGWALGRQIPVIPIRAGTDPYGFIGKYQGVASDGKDAPEVALEVFQIIVGSALSQDIDFGANIEFLINSIKRYSNESGIEYILKFLYRALPLISDTHLKSLQEKLENNKSTLFSIDVLSDIAKELERNGNTKYANIFEDLYIPF